MESTVTVDDIKNCYLLAWRSGCNGITVFRDGCKSSQVLNVGIKDDKKEKPTEYEITSPVPALERPFMVNGATYRINTPVGTAFVTINQDEKKNPLELFINVGKAGSDVAAMAEALGRTISIALRFRGNLNSKDRAREIAEQLAGIGGRRSVGYGPNKILSLPDAIAMAISINMGFKINGYLQYAEKTLEKGRAEHDQEPLNGEYKNGKSNGIEKIDTLMNGNSMIQAEIFKKENLEVPEKNTNIDQLSFSELKVKGDICPTCGVGAMVYQEGCSKCYACGHSEC
jgi:ribonucleoside-diphosphate reductase alpha chain